MVNHIHTVRELLEEKIVEIEARIQFARKEINLQGNISKVFPTSIADETVKESQAIAQARMDGLKLAKRELVAALEFLS